MKAKKVFKNQYVFSIFTKILVVAIGFMNSVIIARYFGPNIKGLTATILNYSNIIAILLTFGLHEAYPFFLKKQYNKKEIKKSFPKILNFYKKYCKIYPNYIPLIESKYLYRNIKRKQKIIYQLQEIKEEKKLKTYSTIITSQALNSINENTISNKLTTSKEEEDINKLINDINFYEELINKKNLKISN